ncbi:MAG: hypothetical protein QOE14_2504 [Humisphaera sp.]|nr:hypothetical protein [Humisphaera sp.]
MRNRVGALIVVMCVVVFAAGGRAARGAAATGASEKSRYALFDPTPRQLMRELSTDRPDVTESPHTVDAGHFQIELSLVEYTHDSDGGAKLDEFVVLPTNFKVGLLNNVDLQLVVEPYVHQRIRAGGNEDSAAGLGATQLRVKINLWGNEGDGQTALAIMPFVQFPTADDDIGGVDDVEGGIAVPLAVKLPNEWDLGLMAEVDFLRDVDDQGYGIAFLHTAAIGHPISEKLGGFVEYAGIANNNLGVGYLASVGGGVTYAIGDDAQLDAAAYVGLSEDADDFTARVGLSFRI